MIKFEYIAYGLLAITALIVIINLVKGVLRGLKKTIASLVAIVASALVAAIVTLIVCTPSSPLMVAIIDFVNSNLDLGQFGEIFTITEITETLAYYVTMIIAPFFFVALYCVLSLIFGIAASVICRFIPPIEVKKAKKTTASRLGGMGVGVACGLIVSLIMLMPVVGVIDIAATAGEVILESDGVSEAVLDDDLGIETLIKDASENGVMKVYRVGFGWMFDLMASADFEGERVYLKNDVTTIIAMIPHFSSITSGELDKFGEQEIDALEEFVDGIDRSALLKHTLSGVISEMTGKWSVGENFMGIEKISAGEMLDPMLDSMIGVFATTTRDTVGADLRTTTGVFGTLIRHGMLDDMEDYDGMLEKLGNDGVIKELIIIVNENERMSVVSDEITRLSIRALAITLDVPRNANALYGLIIDDIFEAVEKSRYSTDRVLAVATSIEETFEKYGLEIAGGEAVLVANGLVTDLGDVPNLKRDHVEQFFLLYSAASGNAGSEMYSGNGSSFESLSSGVSITINSDDTISIGGRVLDPEVYDNHTYGSSAAFLLGVGGESIGDAKYLYSADETAKNSSMVTLDMILSNVRKYSECDDPDREAEKINEMFALAAELFAGDGIKGKDYDELIEDMGTLLDKMLETQVFSKESTSFVMKAIMQSDTVKDEMGLTVKEAGVFSDKLNNLVTDEYSYADATGTVSSTITMVNSVKDDNITKEERRENTQKLIEDLDPEKADMLSSMVTPNSMVKFGSSKEKSENVADSVSTLFTNMANFNAEPGSEEYKYEADAVNTVLDLAMKGADDSDARRLFNSTDEVGKLDANADDFVSVIVESEVVSATIISAAEKGEENPYGIRSTEQDKEELTAAMENYYAENSVDKSEEELAELQTRLNALAVITDLPLMFDVQ